MFENGCIQLPKCFWALLTVFPSFLGIKLPAKPNTSIGSSARDDQLLKRYLQIWYECWEDSWSSKTSERLLACFTKVQSNLLVSAHVLHCSRSVYGVCSCQAIEQISIAVDSVRGIYTTMTETIIFIMTKIKWKLGLDMIAYRQDKKRILWSAVSTVCWGCINIEDLDILNLYKVNI